MRHPLTLLLAVSVPANSLGAQARGDSNQVAAHGQRGTFVGPFLGIVSTGLDGVDYRADFSVGVQWERVSENVFVRSGVFYTGRGSQSTPLAGGGKLKEHYVEFPLLFGYRPPAGGRTRVFMMGGGLVGVRANSNCGPHCYAPHAFDYGVLVGGGLTLPVGTANLVLDMRVLDGLEDDRTNRGFTFGAAYMRSIGRHR